MSASTIYWLIIVICIFEYILDAVLDYLNVKASKLPIPDLLKDLYDEDKYRKQQEYFAANTRFGRISSTFDSAVSLALFAFGVFGWYAGVLQGWTESAVLQTIIFLATTELVSDITGLPFSWYNVFVIEEKFGFNKSTRKTFIGDFFKGLGLNLVVQSLLMGGLCAIYQWIPDYFWIAGFALMAGFSIVFSYLYSDIIVPLFNKQTPLPDGELRGAILAFAQKVDFKLKDIYVIDGSKRSSKANAYFTGFGRRKRIVLYDTLIEKMTVDETVAVLAHEIGHYKNGHIWKGMVSGLMQSFVIMFLLGLVLGSDEVGRAAGAEGAVFIINMLVFMMLWTPVSLVTGIFGNIVSRRNERQADAFACRYGLGESLASALKKLSADSLSNLTPHPAVVFMSYSHPTLYERVKACTQN